MAAQGVDKWRDQVYGGLDEDRNGRRDTAERPWSSWRR